MPIEELRDFENFAAPGNHQLEDPATLHDVEVAGEYKVLVDFHDVAAAALHLHDTASYIGVQNPQALVLGLQPMLNQIHRDLGAICNQNRALRNDSRIQTQRLRNQIQGLRDDNRALQVDNQALRNNIDQLRRDIARDTRKIERISLETAIQTAQNTNRGRRTGTTLPLIPVRYPNGELPTTRPPLTSLRAINELNYPILRAYFRDYGLGDPENVDEEQLRRDLRKII